MSKIILSLGFTGLCVCVGCSNEKDFNKLPFDNPNGFGNHFFGSSSTAFSGIQFFKNAKTKGVKVYGVTQGNEESWLVDDVKISAVDYYFYQDSLCQIGLVCDINDANKMYQILEKKLGTPSQPAITEKPHNWKGKVYTWDKNGSTFSYIYTLLPTKATTVQDTMYASLLVTDDRLRNRMTAK